MGTVKYLPRKLKNSSPRSEALPLPAALTGWYTPPPTPGTRFVGWYRCFMSTAFVVCIPFEKACALLKSSLQLLAKTFFFFFKKKHKKTKRYRIQSLVAS